MEYGGSTRTPELPGPAAGHLFSAGKFYYVSHFTYPVMFLIAPGM